MAIINKGLAKANPLLFGVNRIYVSSYDRRSATVAQSLPKGVRLMSCRAFGM
jgi:hypothetical protein